MILPYQCVFGFGEDADQGLLVQWFQRSEHREATNEFRYQAKLAQVAGLGFIEHGFQFWLCVSIYWAGMEADPSLCRGQSFCHMFLQAGEGTAGNEQNVAGVDDDFV